MIDVFWANDIPANIVVLTKGLSYFEERDFYKEKQFITNNLKSNYIWYIWQNVILKLNICIKTPKLKEKNYVEFFGYISIIGR